MSKTERNVAVTVSEDSQDTTMRDYARVVWRRRWIVVAAAVLLMALALAYSLVKMPMYKASAQLIYDTPLNVADPLGSGSSVNSTPMQIALSSVSSEIASPELVQSVRTTLGPGRASSGYAVSAAPDTTSGQTEGNTVSITVVSANADTAARAANAYAASFIASRKARAQTQVQQAERVIQSKLDSFQSENSRLSADYVTLLQRLQDLQILEATVTGNFRILVPAVVPSQPYTPKPVRNGMMGLAAGLVFGVALALLLEQFDTRVRRPEEAVAIFGMPMLGQIRKIPSRVLEQQPLYVLTDSHNPAGEAVRKLRGNLEFSNVDGDLGSLFITSCLQHEGKSLTICNLALAMAASGRRVVLVDGDMRRPQLHRYLNLPNGVGLSSLLTGKSTLEKVMHSLSVGPQVTKVRVAGGAGAAFNGGDRLNVLTSGPSPPNPAEIIASKSFAHVMGELREKFDLVLVDAPALLAVSDTAAIARCVDGLVFLVDLTRAKRPLLVDAAMQIAQMPCRKLGLVVMSQAPSRRYERDHYSYYSHVETPLGVDASAGSRREAAPL
jgi:Mrp family chromosome partitioning ATPase/capsular polysaccharide biosynthesis protein